MGLYTKAGDGGQTRLMFGVRVSKSDPRCEACGTVDEAVSAIGLARALCGNVHIKRTLLQLQREMFVLCTELATDPAHYDHLRAKLSVVSADTVSRIERSIDEVQAQVELPGAFIVPGASPGSGALDLARSLVRRAERRVVALQEERRLPNPEILRYLNRLSDLLFVLARLEDKDLPLELAAEQTT